MKHLILTISLILGATAASAGSHFKDYGFPKKDCHEMFAGIGGLLEEADKEWAYLEKIPEGSPDALEHAAKILLSHFCEKLNYKSRLKTSEINFIALSLSSISFGSKVSDKPGIDLTNFDEYELLLEVNPDTS